MKNEKQESENGLAVLLIDIRDSRANVKLTNCGITHECLRALYDSAAVRCLFGYADGEE